MLTDKTKFVASLPFTSTNARSYVANAFQLTRVFKYEWTVNWRFLPESTFLSPQFAVQLLAAHAAVLLLFFFTRWTKPLGRSPRDLARLAFANPDPVAQKRIFNSLNADFILTTILTSMLIGMLCARSLHYQFFAYIAWSTPFLLHKAGINPALMWVIWLGQEMAWNVYPPAELTSKIVVGTLAAVVFNVWTHTGEKPVGNVEEMAERVRVENARNEAKLAEKAEASIGVGERQVNGSATSTATDGKSVRFRETERH